MDTRKEGGDLSDVGWLDRVIASCGMVVLRPPTRGWMQSYPEDALMVFHFCPNRNKDEGRPGYRFDRHSNLFSEEEGFTCGACGKEHRTRCLGYPTLQFYTLECLRIASEERSTSAFLARFIWYFIFGIRKHMPKNRGGRTSGELVTRARRRGVVRILARRNSHPRLVRET